MADHEPPVSGDLGAASDHRAVSPGPRARLWPLAMLAVWAAILIALGLVRGPSRAQSGDDGARLLIEGVAGVRQAYWARQLGAISSASDMLSGQTRDGLAKMKALAETENSVRAWRLYGLSQYMLGSGDWRASLAKIRDAEPRRRVADTDRELASWRAVLERDHYAGGTIGSSSTPTLALPRKGGGERVGALPRKGGGERVGALPRQGGGERVGAIPRQGGGERVGALPRQGGEDRARRRAASESRDFIESLNLGWFRHAALAAMYSNHGMSAQARASRNDALRSANRLTIGAVLFLLAALVGLALWCMGLFALMIVGRAGIRRRIVGLSSPPRFSAQALTMAAAAYFAGLVALRFVSPLLPDSVVAYLSGDGAASARAGLTILVGIIALAPPVAVMCRASSRVAIGPATIGLVRIRPWRDVAVGLAGYLAALPPLALTVFISTRLFEAGDSRMNPAVVDFASNNGLAPRLLLLLAGSVK
ncbi:MAG: hypothetical protein FJX72_14445, partial [Armatimonadetes bacterium]|nr:hypothetical protein [Armatimonadota bacterium]